jgi:transcriptional/translational regulatory protein YebC/TACO1
MKDMAVVRDSLKAMNFVLETSLAAVPKEGTVSLNDEDFQLNMEAIDRFLDLDDVDSQSCCFYCLSA